MEYKYTKCPICGSEEINIVLYNEDDEGNIFYKYKCNSCDSYFSSDKLIKKRNYQDSHNTSKIEESSKTKQGTVPTAKQVFEQDIPYTLEIQSVQDDSNSKCDLGTGIIISKQYILTNAHVVIHNEKPNKNCIAKTSKGETFDLEIVSYDIKNDIAFLKSNVLFKDSIPFRKTEVSTGEVCYAIGNPLGEGLSFLNGIISDNHRNIEGKDFIMFSAPITSGNSGGPLLDEYGVMIGMVTLKTKDEVGMNYAIPNSTISKFLEGLKNND